MGKKLVVILVVLAMVAGFAFAGGGKEKSKDDLEIAAVYMNITVPFAGLIKQGVDAAADELGINAYMTGATDWTTEAQYKVIEDLIAKKVDGISIAVLDIPGLTPVIEKGMDAGIPVTCFNVDAPDSSRMGFVGEDLFVAGAETAETLIEYMGEEGKVIISSVAIGAIWSIKRQNGVMSVLDKYPGIEVVEIVNADGSEQEAYAALENALLAHPDVDGMVSLGGTQYLWGRLLANKGIGNMDSAKPIYNTGHDLYEEKLLQIQDGWATAAFGQDPFKQGYLAIKQLYEYITESKKPTVVDTGVVRVDASNVADFLKRLADGEPIG